MYPATCFVCEPMVMVSPRPSVSASTSVEDGSSASRFWSRVTMSSRVPSLTLPLSGARCPVSRLRSVVLPAPFGPTMPTRSPRWMRMDRSETMTRPS